jgi:hypothetical protein
MMPRLTTIVTSGLLALLIPTDSQAFKTRHSESPNKPVSNESYICEITKETSFGQIRASRTLDGEKRLIGSSASWRSKPPPANGLSLAARWFSEGPSDVDFSTGVFSVDVDVNTPERRKLLQGKKFSFEITTLVTSRGFTVGGIRNSPRRWREFAADIRENFITGWADIFAMSKGTSQLNIVARDQKNQALTSSSFDSSSLADAHEQAQKLSEEVRFMSTANIDKCEYSSGTEILI